MRYFWMKWIARMARIASISCMASIICSVFIALMLFGCNGGSGSEATEGKITGRVLNSDGTSANGAGVFIRQKEFLSDTSQNYFQNFAADAYTGKDGTYSLPTQNIGEYILEIRDGLGNSTLLNSSVLKANDDRTFPTSTLAPSGSISGTLEKNLKIKGAVFIRILGLDRVTPADSNGHFSFQDIPAGNYSLVITPSLPGTGYFDPGLVKVKSAEVNSLDTVHAMDPDKENYGTWLHSAKIILRPMVNTITDSIADFPLLLSLNENNFDFSEARRDGGDFRIADTNGIPLHYEIERWNQDLKKAEIWIHLPFLRKTDGDAGIRIYWGNPKVTAFSASTLVFNSGYGFSSAWHFGNSLKDATPNGNHGLAGGTEDFEGRIGQGRQFQKKNHDSILVKYSPSFSLTAFSVTVWAKPTSLQAENMGLLGSRFGSDYTFDFKFTPKGLHGDLGDGNNWLSQNLDYNFKWNPDTWYHISYVVGNGMYRIYLNGILVSEEKYSGKALFMKNIQMLNIGNCFISPDLASEPYRDEHFDGILDEMQISNQIRSPEWIRQAYENQKANSNFIEIVR